MCFVSALIYEFINKNKKIMLIELIFFKNCVIIIIGLEK